MCKGFFSPSPTSSFAVWLSPLLLAACGESVIYVESSSADSSVDLANGLLVYLPFDEMTAGSMALDASGHDHHGTPSSSPPTPTSDVPPSSGSNLRSLSFDGLDQLIDLGNPPSLDVEGVVTLCAWINSASSVEGFRNIVAHGFAFSPSQELVLRISDEFYEFMAWDGVNHLVRTPVRATDIGTWLHIVGMYDGRAYRLYLDGELVALRADDFSPTRVDANWSIGGRSITASSDKRLFAGLIDEVRIYGRVLSDDEVRVLAGL
jgi:hypothetical protein